MAVATAIRVVAGVAAASAGAVLVASGPTEASGAVFSVDLLSPGFESADFAPAG